MENNKELFNVAFLAAFITDNYFNDLQAGNGSIDTYKRITNLALKYNEHEKTFSYDEKETNLDDEMYTFIKPYLKYQSI